MIDPWSQLCWEIWPVSNVQRLPSWPVILSNQNSVILKAMMVCPAEKERRKLAQSGNAMGRQLPDLLVYCNKQSVLSRISPWLGPKGWSHPEGTPSSQPNPYPTCLHDAYCISASLLLVPHRSRECSDCSKTLTSRLVAWKIDLVTSENGLVSRGRCADTKLSHEMIGH